MFKFDVYLFHTRHSFKTKIIKKLQLTLQNGAGCWMCLCYVISSVALKCSKIND